MYNSYNKSTNEMSFSFLEYDNKFEALAPKLVLGGMCSQGAHFSEEETGSKREWALLKVTQPAVELTRKARLSAPVLWRELASPVPLSINGGLVLTCLRPHLHEWPWRCLLKGGVPLSTSWGTGEEAGSAEERGSPWLGWGTEAVKVLGREKTWVRPSP